VKILNRDLSGYIVFYLFVLCFKHFFKRDISCDVIFTHNHVEFYVICIVLFSVFITFFPEAVANLNEYLWMWQHGLYCRVAEVNDETMTVLMGSPGPT
jgi:hypothetical protein